MKVDIQVEHLPYHQIHLEAHEALHDIHHGPLQIAGGHLQSEMDLWNPSDGKQPTN